ncbi:MAG: ABC transporter permease [Anaerolineaceae bacterium]|nr:ABC transporter permease [Anaerolineaceae bacterium]
MEDIQWIVGLQGILVATIRLATPLIFSGIGLVIAEQAGVVNIGLEGIMLLGAFTGWTIGFYSGSLILGLAAVIIVGLISGLIFALFTVTIRANQIVVGVAFNMLGIGLSGFLYRTLFGREIGLLKLESFQSIEIPFLSNLPFIGKILFQQNILVYSSFVFCLLAIYVLYHTAAGLAIRSVGEHPRAADTMGINVFLVRYLCVLMSGVGAALGGAFLSIAYTNIFVENIVSGRGYITLAIVAFGRWKPVGTLIGALIFGLFYAIQLNLQSLRGIVIPYHVFQALPYFMTILALLSMRGRAIRPKALGKPYEPSA